MIDLAGDTATAADVAQGKYFHLATGERVQGTATGGGGTGGVTQDQDGYIVLDDEAPPGAPTLITKTITENGTYAAEDDSADGYSEVTVNVSGGGSGSGDLKALVERTATTQLTFPSDLTAVGAYAFYEYSSLAITSLPNNVTIIDSYAFFNCTNLALTSLPSSLTSIRNDAFRGCEKLAITNLPSGVTDIGINAFYNCERISLTSLPSGVTSIGGSAFSGCSGIYLTELPVGITSLEAYVFTDCYNIALTSLPSGVRTIGNYAFARCASLISITSNGTITSIGTNSFVGNSSHPMQLESVSFPNAALGGYLGTAFGSTTAANACQHLEFCDLGTSYGLGSNAFANCYSLSTLVLRRPSVAVLGNVSALLNTPMRGYNGLTGTVYVPSALISSYQTATNWSTLYNDGTVTFVAIEGSEYEL